jgi:predicted MFS family arabinose efflux permease
MIVTFQIYSPFWAIWLFNHFTYFLGTIIDVIFWIASLLIAMPAGAFADRYGRKPTIVLGVGIWMAGVVAFGFSGSFVTFTLSNVVWAFGAGFLWGANSAYLYDTLLEVHAETRYPAVSSRVTLYTYLGTAFASLVGGVIIFTTTQINMTLVLYAIPGLAALVLGLTFQEPSVPRTPEPSLFGQIRSGFRTARRNRQIVLVILFQVLVGFVSYMMALFRGVFLNQSLGGNLLVVAIIYSLFYLVTAVSGGLTGSFMNRFGETGGLLLVFIMVFVPFPLIYFIAQGAFPPGVRGVLAMVTQLPDYVVLGIEAVLIATIINRRVESEGRATVLAVEAFFSTLVIAVMEPIAGLVATVYSLGTGISLGALVASLPTAYILVAYRRSERTNAGRVDAEAPVRGR